MFKNVMVYRIGPDWSATVKCVRWGHSICPRMLKVSGRDFVNLAHTCLVMIRASSAS